MKIYLHNFGCKLNLAEIQSIYYHARSVGYQPVRQSDQADVILINGCHVTEKAHQKLITYMNRLPDNKKIIVTGCLPKKFVHQIHSPQVKVFSSSHKHLIPAYLNQIFETPKQKSHHYFRTREFIKIQSGCSTRCSYCIIPQYRGCPISRSPQEIIDEINHRSPQARELVLTGTNLGQYQYHHANLAQLLSLIIKYTSIPRIRISSIDVGHINSELILVLQHPKICPHLHLALQSGSDRILQLMKRPYTSQEYRRAIEMVRNIPDLTITTDVIVGFPGESDSDFQQTCQTIVAVGFLKTHIFTYSEHPECASAKIFPKISPSDIRERLKIIRPMANNVGLTVKKQFIGQTFPVLFERYQTGKSTGYTSNYLPVTVAGKKIPRNHIRNIRISGLEDDRLTGEMVV